jgi:hypothetical protein
MRPSPPPPDAAAARRTRRAALAALAVVTPLGFASKAWPAPGAAWIADHGGDVAYVLFWLFAARAALPRASAARTATAVLLATCAVELLQLWRPPWLQHVRATFLGHALLGSTFAWVDLAWYAAAALAGFALDRAVARASARPPGAAS